MFRKSIITLIIILSIIHVPVIPAAGQEQQSFVLASNRPKESLVNQWWTLIYNEVFKRFGAKVEIISLPLKRASILADRGEVDGEAIRVYKYAKAHPNLIRIPEPTAMLKLVAYTGRSDMPKINSWNDLQGKNYNVQYAYGAYIAETNLKSILKPEQVSFVYNATAGLKGLKLKRKDIYIDDENVVFPLLSQPEFKGSIETLGIVEKVSLHLYVHKRHAAIVPKLSKIIKDIKKEGLIEKYWNQIFNKQQKQ